MDLSFLENFNLWQLPGILTGLACYSVRFALILIGVIIVFSGILFVISRGNPVGFVNAKKTFLYAVIGGLVIYGVYTIILSLSFILTGSTSLSWIPLTCS